MFINMGVGFVCSVCVSHVCVCTIACEGAPWCVSMRLYGGVCLGLTPGRDEVSGLSGTVSEFGAPVGGGHLTETSLSSTRSSCTSTTNMSTIQCHHDRYIAATDNNIHRRLFGPGCHKRHIYV